MPKNIKNGTFIHGIAASEHLDSSGERILVKGIDISSLTKDGVFNWEHKGENASQIVGKILDAKKILKRDDCDNDAQKYFWDKIKTPYIYVAGELFDHVGHTAAQDVAAMLKYDKNTNKSETKALINFSIEGSRLGKEGSTITKCIARKVTVTITPCNKMAFAEQMEDKKSNKTMGSLQVAKDILDKFKKSEEVEIELMTKSAQKYMSSLAGAKNVSFPKASSARKYSGVGATAGEQKTGSKIEPKRSFKQNDAPDKMKVGDRIDHTGGKPKARTGHSIYNDPDTWKSEKKEKKKKKKISYESNMRKAITASANMGAPSSLTGGAALAKECLDGKKTKKKKKKEEEGMVQLCKFTVMKSLANDSWSRFVHKEELISIITKKQPDLNKNEVLAIAKSYSYVQEKKSELALHSIRKREDV